MIATTIKHGTIVSIEVITLTFRSDHQTILQDQHTEGESAFLV